MIQKLNPQDFKDQDVDQVKVSAVRAEPKEAGGAVYRGGAALLLVVGAVFGFAGFPCHPVLVPPAGDVLQRQRRHVVTDTDTRHRCGATPGARTRLPPSPPRVVHASVFLAVRQTLNGSEERQRRRPTPPASAGSPS